MPYVYSIHGRFDGSANKKNSTYVCTYVCPIHVRFGGSANKKRTVPTLMTQSLIHIIRKTIRQQAFLFRKEEQDELIKSKGLTGSHRQSEAIKISLFIVPSVVKANRRETKVVNIGGHGGVVGGVVLDGGDVVVGVLLPHWLGSNICLEN